MNTLQKEMKVRPALSKKDRECLANRQRPLAQHASTGRVRDITAPMPCVAPSVSGRRSVTIEAKPKGKKKLRVAAYCRVSTDHTEQMISIDAQRRHYEDFINSNPDWELAGIYWETGISGTKAETRPELQRLIGDCESKRVDLVLTKSISRFARNTVDCLEMVRMLTSLGVGIIFQKENLDTRAMDSEFLLTLFSSIAEEESCSISTNVKWAVQKRFLNGTFHYSKAPYGYTLENGTFILDPAEAEIVKEIYNRVLSGDGTMVIAKDLNERGIPTGTKRRDGTEGVWSTAMILGIIKNITYTGDILMQKSFSGRDYRRRKNRGECQQYYMDGHHAQIIDHETYRLANETVAQRGKEKGNSPMERMNPRMNRYAFTGKLLCGCCGETMLRITGGDNSNKKYYWGCTAHTLNTEACSMNREKEETIKNTFATMLNKLAFAPIIEIYVDLLRVEEQERGGRDAAALREKEKSIQDERSRLTFLLSKGCSEPVSFRKRAAALENEEAALQNDLKRLREETPEMREALAAKRVVSALPIDQDVDATFTAMVDHAIVKTGESVTFYLKCGLILTEFYNTVPVTMQQSRTDCNQQSTA